MNTCNYKIKNIVSHLILNIQYNTITKYSEQSGTCFYDILFETKCCYQITNKDGLVYFTIENGDSFDHVELKFGECIVIDENTIHSCSIINDTNCYLCEE